MQHREQLLQQLDEKMAAIGQNADIHLEGLVWAKPITYWDYIQTDVLLNLQKQRTTLPDEMIFIMYHQVNELLFKMALWEAEQIVNNDQPDAAFLAERVRRMSRYFDVLAASFTIMSDGMAYEQYMKFRTTLTPASGFQSAQYRFIEFISTHVEHLTDARYRELLGAETPVETIYEHLYWHAAGKDYATGKKTTLIELFEERYKKEFLERMTASRERNILTVYQGLPEADRNNETLITAMRHYDRTVNITWVMAHFHAAESYLDRGNATEGTGGSNWKKYMHPKYQRRIFFPELWTEDERTHWGEDAI